MPRMWRYTCDATRAFPRRRHHDMIARIKLIRLMFLEIMLIAMAGGAHAYQIFPCTSLEWQIADSDLIVLGHCNGIETHSKDGHAYAIITLTVDRSLKGKPPAEIRILIEDWQAKRLQSAKPTDQVVCLLVKSQRLLDGQNLEPFKTMVASAPFSAWRNSFSNSIFFMSGEVRQYTVDLA